MLRGLYGPLVVHPTAESDAVDVVAITHTYSGTRTLNGEEGVVTSPDVADGQVARVRVINTDNGAVQVWTDAPYKVLAVDGRDVNGPSGRGRPDVPLLDGPPGGFLDGKPGMWWSIDGHLWPDVPMYVVDEGDLVVFEIANHGGEVHPMHLHGHHAVVLSRDGEAASGSPWWVDSLDVEDGETMSVALVADNPGIWMDHCHNLKHAAQASSPT